MLIITGVLILGQAVLADSAILSTLPAIAERTVGTPFNVSVQIDPTGNRVCVVKGTISLDNLSCQSVTLADGIKVQTTPTCDAPNFVLGIPKCTTAPQNLFSISVKGRGVGQANLSFTEVKVVKVEGIIASDVAFDLQNGSFNLIAPAKATAPLGTTGAQSPQGTTTQPATTTTSVGQTAGQSTTSASGQQATSNRGFLAGVAAVGSAVVSNYVWSLLIVLCIACIIYYFVKKRKNTE